MFFETVPKHSTRFTNVLIFTTIAPIMINGTTFLRCRILVFWCDYCIADCPACFEVYHDTMFSHRQIDDINILDREGNGFARLIRESIYIRANNPTLNRNVGKYQLPHIYDTLIKDNKCLRVT